MKYLFLIVLLFFFLGVFAQKAIKTDSVFSIHFVSGPDVAETPPDTSAFSVKGLVNVLPEEAGKYINKSVIISGHVFNVQLLGNNGAMLLTMGSSIPKKYFTLRIKKENFNNFDSPAIVYNGKEIRVTGKVTTFEDKPEIELTNPNQIQIAQTLTIDQVCFHVQDSLNTNYHPDSVALSRLCRRACIFIKFKVSENGDITNLEFSEDSIRFIKEALTKAVESLKRDVQLINTLKASGKTIIQPFIYDYQAGCNFDNETDFAVILKRKPEDKPKKSNLEIQNDMEYFGATISQMLNFTNGKVYAVDCLLLAPFTVSSGYMY